MRDHVCSRPPLERGVRIRGHEIRDEPAEHFVAPIAELREPAVAHVDDTARRHRRCAASRASRDRALGSAARSAPAARPRCKRRRCAGSRLSAPRSTIALARQSTRSPCFVVRSTGTLSSRPVRRSTGRYSSTIRRADSRATEILRPNARQSRRASNRSARSHASLASTKKAVLVERYASAPGSCGIAIDSDRRATCGRYYGFPSAFGNGFP